MTCSILLLDEANAWSAFRPGLCLTNDPIRDTQNSIVFVIVEKQMNGSLLELNQVKLAAITRAITCRTIHVNLRKFSSN